MPQKRTTNKNRTATNKTGRKTGTLVPQPHGGALLNGMAPNHVPGPGRPPNDVRAAMRLSLDKRLGVLEQIIDGTMHEPGDRIRALEVLARYGLGTKDEVSLTDHPEWQSRMTALRSALVEIVGEETATAVILRADELARRR